jgi:CIC family chloride channel protein
LLGGAFGLAARLLLGDPRIDPGAFALVGMGTFYGGIAHVPISSLVLVSELAGSFDLLVPLMLAGGIAFVALRHRSLYATQPADRGDSPVHRTAARLDALDDVLVRDLQRVDRAIVSVPRDASLAAIMESTANAAGQDVFPVVDANGRLEGLISSDTLRFASHSRELSPWAIADDIMLPPISVSGDDDARTAASNMLDNGLNEIPVVDHQGRVVALLSEAEIFRLVLAPPDAPIAQ